MVSIELISNNLWEYAIIIVISIYFLLTFEKDFSKEGLIDYFIYLTTKILLFLISFSFLVIFSITIIDGIQPITEIFLKEFINQVLIYSVFNYGIFYLLKFFVWIGEIVKKNDLYNIEFITKVEGKEK